jgi:hypothetical protein
VGWLAETWFGRRVDPREERAESGLIRPDGRS